VYTHLPVSISSPVAAAAIYQAPVIYRAYSMQLPLKDIRVAGLHAKGLSEGRQYITDV
jgi:hypothetical protein